MERYVKDRALGTVAHRAVSAAAPQPTAVRDASQTFGTCGSSSNISTDGICSKNGMTCKGSAFGDCCSSGNLWQYERLFAAPAARVALELASPVPVASPPTACAGRRMERPARAQPLEIVALRVASVVRQTTSAVQVAKAALGLATVEPAAFPLMGCAGPRTGKHAWVQLLANVAQARGHAAIRPTIVARGGQYNHFPVVLTFRERNDGLTTAARKTAKRAFRAHA